MSTFLPDKVCKSWKLLRDCTFRRNRVRMKIPRQTLQQHIQCILRALSLLHRCCNSKIQGLRSSRSGKDCTHALWIQRKSGFGGSLGKPPPDHSRRLFPGHNRCICWQLRSRTHTFLLHSLGTYCYLRLRLLFLSYMAGTESLSPCCSSRGCTIHTLRTLLY